MSDEDLKRHFQVLTEHLDSKIRILAEGQSALAEQLSKRIDGLEATMRAENEETQGLVRDRNLDWSRPVA